MSRETHRLLIVEDDAGLAELIGDTLSQSGLQCDLLASGAECLSRLQTDRPDLLIVDYSLPDMTGVALIEAIQHAGTQVPFVVITGHGDEELAVRAMKLGALDYFVKDGRLLGQLPDAIRRILKEVVADRRVAAAQEALRESEERYRLLLAAVTDYVYVVQLDHGRPVSSNHGPGCRTVTGYAPEDYAANPLLWLDMVPESDRAALEQHALAALAGQTLAPIEHRILRKDGSLGWVQNNIIPRRDEAGHLVACDGIINDLTERKRAEARLARNQAELTTLYEHAPIMMMLLDVEKRVKRLNRAALDFVGRTPMASLNCQPGDLLGCPNADGAHGCGRSPACDSCVLCTALHSSAVKGISHSRVEFRHNLVRHDRTSELVLLVSTAGITVQGEHMVLLCLEDITQHKQAEERVREQAALLDVSRDAIFVLDLDHRVTFWNRCAEQLYGWTRAEALGRLSDDLISPPPPAARAALEALGEWSGELKRTSRTGQIYTVQSRATLVRNAAGQPRSLLVVDTDITEAKRLEAQFLRAQRLDSLGQLASGVAHDLNNVLAPVLISIELLRPLVTTPDDEEILDVLKNSVQRGTNVVRQLLLFGRGSDEPRAKLAVGPVINELGHIVRETFPKNIVITVDVAPDLPAILADATQIHQVLLNLCVNARDAMPQGGTLRLTARSQTVDPTSPAVPAEAKPGPHVVLRVSDTGTGIPSALLDKIFDPFFTTKPIGSGTGLGLSTVLGIVRSHGGFVTVQSQEGEGTEFRVHLPAAESATTGATASGARSATRGQGETVLIAEDEVAIREVLRRSLVAANYHVLAASDGVEALSLYSQHRATIRVVVTDVMMPVMDGVEMIRRLRQIEPRVPIIALSGLHHSVERLRREGWTDVQFLRKPFETAALLGALHQALSAPA